MVASGNLGSVMVSTQVRNARDVGSIPALGAIFPIFITPHNTTNAEYEFDKLLV